MKVTENHITALRKLIGNSGIRFAETLNLTKKDFNLNKKLILVVSKKTNKTRYATIYPSDVNWFKNWFESFDGKLFPFRSITLAHHMKKYGTPHSFRKQLALKMLDMGCDNNMIYVKLGRYLDEEVDYNKVLQGLLKWELQFHENVEVKP